ncbi:hypothetical protein [Shinella sp. M31]|uniref:hypothetical protein n=1 Tax=Shinella sp. M31 TaxID=3368615 RepID=UPI003B9F11E3
MKTVDEIWGNPDDIAAELHRTMQHANDLIKRAAHAGLSVDFMMLNMHGADGAIPQISFAVKNAVQREKDEVRARR